MRTARRRRETQRRLKQRRRSKPQPMPKQQLRIRRNGRRALKITAKRACGCTIREGREWSMLRGDTEMPQPRKQQRPHGRKPRKRPF